MGCAVKGEPGRADKLLIGSLCRSPYLRCRVQESTALWFFFYVRSGSPKGGLVRTCSFTIRALCFLLARSFVSKMLRKDSNPRCRSGSAASNSAQWAQKTGEQTPNVRCLLPGLHRCLAQELGRRWGLLIGSRFFLDPGRFQRLFGRGLGLGRRSAGLHGSRFPSVDKQRIFALGA